MDALRTISWQEFEEVLSKHTLWLSTQGQEGKCADLSAIDLRPFTAHLGYQVGLGSFPTLNLSKAKLCRANLSGMILHSLDVSKANLSHIIAENSGFTGAVFSGADLSNGEFANSDFSNALFVGANLQRAELKEANLHKANLTEANLTGASCVGANFQNTNFRGTILRDAHLQEAILDKPKELEAPQLGGSNLTGAKLSEPIGKIEGLTQVEHISKIAGKLFVSIILGCVYAFLTIMSTTDARLVTNTASSPLPILQTEVRIADFYKYSPIFFLSAYIYFHLYLCRLWIALAGLPAFFPDGRPLDEKAYPWMFTSFVRAHMKLLNSSRSLFSLFERITLMLLGWWLVPFTLAICWLRALPKHDLWLSSIQGAAVLCAIFAGGLFQGRMKFVLQGKKSSVHLPIAKQPRKLLGYTSTVEHLGRTLLITVVALIALLVLWDGSYNGTRVTLPADVYDSPGQNAGLDLREQIRHSVPKFLFHLDWSAFARLTAKDVSVKPTNWFLRADDELIRISTGAQLPEADLRRAVATQAFLVKANLRKARLDGATLSAARLTKADLTEATLFRADLSHAELQESIFTWADLRGASLAHAMLKEARLDSADLSGADLTEARMEEAYLVVAKLIAAMAHGANLSRADLTGAFMERTQFRGAILEYANLKAARLCGTIFNFAIMNHAHMDGVLHDCPPELPTPFHRSSFIEAQLRQVSMRAANLDKSSFAKSDLRGADLSDAVLEFADFTGAMMQGATLQNAKLNGADLRTAIGLTQKQIDSACSTETTLLPPKLRLKYPCNAIKNKEMRH